jgi:RNA polymerase sigma factor (sigma-70 family)
MNAIPTTWNETEAKLRPFLYVIANARLTTRPDVADDVTQLALLQVWKSMESGTFQVARSVDKRGNVRERNDIQALKTYARSIVINKITDHLRIARNREGLFASNEPGEEMSAVIEDKGYFLHTTDPDAVNDPAEGTDFRAFMASLPPQRRRIALLYIREYSTEDIAHELGVSTSTVRSHTQGLRGDYLRFFCGERGNLRSVCNKLR